MRSWGLTLIQYDQCSYKKDSLGPRHMQRADDMKTQGEAGQQQAKGRALEETLSPRSSEETNLGDALV